MKITFIISDYNYHGGAKKTANLAQYIQLLGYKTKIIVLRLRDGDIESRPKHFLNVIDLNSSNTISSIFKLAKIFNKSINEVYICIGTYSNFSAGLAKLFCKKSFTLIGSENFAKSVLIGDYPKFYLRFFYLIFRIAYNQLNGLLFVSGKLRSEFLKKNTWHPSRCKTIYNPVRSSSIKIKKEIKKDSGFVFLGVGVLEPRKRFDLLIESFSFLAGPKDKLLIAGTGSLKNELEKLTIDLGIKSQVIFLNFVSNIESLMSKSDILVLTSNSEAFGMVLAEGLSSGLQVVSTNSFSGPAEVLGHGKYGYLAEVDNLESITSAMRSSMIAPKSNKIIKEGASRFLTDRVVKEYIEFISAITESSGNLYDQINFNNNKKRILINVSVITKIYRGMAVFTKQIVKQLIKNDNFEFIFVSGNDLDSEISEIISRSNHIYIKINSFLPIFDQIVIPYLIKKYRPDVSWFPSNTFPLMINKKHKVIVTIHDLIFFLKEFKMQTFYQKIANYYRVLNIMVGAKKNIEITSVSKTAMKDIETRLKILNTMDDKNIFYNSFYIVNNSDNEIFKKLNLNASDKYFYSIVGMEKHKNLNFLIDSFTRFNKKNPNYKLVISGAFKSELKDKFKNIIFTSFISENEKTSLIKKAEIFIFPSLIEGFGIPLIEGLYHNSRVLASDIPVFREIGKNYINYFNPYDNDFILKFYNNKPSKINHKEAKSYILRNFDVKISVNKLERLFNES